VRCRNFGVYANFTTIYVYMYVYVCVCVCVRVRVRACVLNAGFLCRVSVRGGQQYESL